MTDGKRDKGPRGGLFQHPLMVRLGATEKTRLEWLSRQKGRPQGTLVRELVTDSLAELFAAGTPLRQKYDREQASRRRNTPIERAARKRPGPAAPAPIVELHPAASAPSTQADEHSS